MKTIPLKDLDDVVHGIFSDAAEIAKHRQETFDGMSIEGLCDELHKQLGSNCKISKAESYTFTQEDFNAVYTSRFGRTKIALGLIFGWLIVILALFSVTVTWQLLDIRVMYGVSTVSCFAFVFLYSAKRKKFRKKFGERYDFPKYWYAGEPPRKIPKEMMR